MKHNVIQGSVAGCVCTQPTSHGFTVTAQIYDLLKSHTQQETPEMILFFCTAYSF